MADYMTYEGDLRAVACAFIDQPEAGSLDHSVFGGDQRLSRTAPGKHGW